MLKKIVLISLVLFSTTFCSSKEEIKSEINSILKRIPASTKVSILVVNPLVEDTIYSRNSKASMIPASNNKLFTTSVALKLMGGSYKLATKILTNAPPMKDGIIHGNVYIKGFGNSLFTEKDLDSLVNVIKNLGVKKITGKIIGDDSYFDEIYTRDDWISHERANVKLPPVSAIVVNRNRYITHRRVWVRRHGRRVLRRYTYHISIKNPPLHAARLLREKLIKAGIKVEKKAVKGKAPANCKEVAESAITLRHLIKEINKHSDNFLAECLFKTLGAVATGKQGNSFYSTQTIIKFMKDNGIYSEGTSVVDGSGISRYDHITVSAIVGLLQKMYFDLHHFKDFFQSLSIAGEDGTLRHRLDGTLAQNNFHGKTGTLNGVSSLSGYLTLPSGDELIVSMIFEFDKHGADYYRNIQDDIVKALAKWK